MPAEQAVLVVISEGYKRRVSAWEREVAELKEERRNILVYLAACCQAFATRTRVPSLIPQTLN